ncbi:MAG: hypothetical protein K2H98_02255 [Duncaniella sp.]|nr:hypothetical protein [Duncaniella sp.]
MKNFIKGLFLSAVLSMSMVACDDEVGLPDNGTPSNPEKAVVGVYEGTWKTTDTKDEVVEYPGTLTFTDINERYVVDVIADCPALFRGPLLLDTDELQSVANISHTSAGYSYHNTLETNGFGSQFWGVVSEDKVATILFKKTIKEGRKQNTYTITFEGALKGQPATEE